MLCLLVSPLLTYLQYVAQAIGARDEDGMMKDQMATREGGSE
jgi:hypothetical protein